jgi:hypothetical protein
VPDPVFSWTIVGLVWGVGLLREAYKAGWKAGNQAAGRSVDLAARPTPDENVTIGGRAIEVDAASIIER